MPRSRKVDRPGGPPVFALRQHREKAGLTQEQVAAAMDMSVGSVSRIEAELQPFMPRTLRAYADAVGATPAELLAGPPDEFGSILAIWKKVPEADRAKLLAQMRAAAGELPDRQG